MGARSPFFRGYLGPPKTMEENVYHDTLHWHQKLGAAAPSNQAPPAQAVDVTCRGRNDTNRSNNGGPHTPTDLAACCSRIEHKRQAEPDEKRDPLRHALFIAYSRNAKWCKPIFKDLPQRKCNCAVQVQVGALNLLALGHKGA